MIRSLPLILLLLPLCYTGGLDDLLDPINDIDNTYHKVKGAAKATEKELVLASILGLLHYHDKLGVLYYVINCLAILTPGLWNQP